MTLTCGDIANSIEDVDSLWEREKKQVIGNNVTEAMVKLAQLKQVLIHFETTIDSMASDKGTSN